jgi:hypothetical protein
MESARSDTITQDKSPSHDFQTQAWDGGVILVYSITANRMLNESQCALLVLKSEAVGRGSHKVSPGLRNAADATGECGELVLCTDHRRLFKAMESGRNRGPSDCPNHRKT